jgi:glutathione peroxidase
MAETIFDFVARANDGAQVPIKKFEGKVLLFVNTASRCGFTPQYKGLEELYKKYKDKGLVVLGFPCDQFAHQEPEDDAAIAGFCERNFGVTFPLMSKIEVNGGKADPIFAFLRKRGRGFFGDAVKWNFTKFLVSPDGKKVKRFAPATEPHKLEADIEKLLAL